MDDETQLHAAYVLINSVLHSALNAVIYPVLSRLALTLQFYLNTYESESAPVAWVALPRGRGDAAPPYFSHRTGVATWSSASKLSLIHI